MMSKPKSDAFHQRCVESIEMRVPKHFRRFLVRT